MPPAPDRLYLQQLGVVSPDRLMEEKVRNFCSRKSLALSTILMIALVCAGCATGLPQATTQTTAPTASQEGGSPATATDAPSSTAEMTVPAAATDEPTATAQPAGATATVQPTATEMAAAAQPNPACTPGALTPAETEGPYYKVNPPERSALTGPDTAGTKLTISGYVFGADCKAIAGARVDFWQADDAGQYDNSGYNLRGYQITDAQGRYTLETVVPGLYPGRTRHIHVKVTPSSGSTLTTQLFFPDEPENSRDGIFNAQTLLTDVQRSAAGETATFNFVVDGR